MALFDELKRRKVVRVGVTYAVVGWVVAQVAEFAFETFGAPQWVLQSLVVVLLLGLPIAIALAWAFEITPDGIVRDDGARDEPANPADASASPQAASSASSPRRRFGILGIVLVVGASIAFAGYARLQQGKEHQVAMLELAAAQSFVLQDRYGEAFTIAHRLKPELEAEPEFTTLWEEITLSIEPRIAQDGVKVSMKAYESKDAQWIELGTTPLANAIAPGGGVILLRLEKEGFVTQEIAVANPSPMLQNQSEANASFFNYVMPEYELKASGQLPENMVEVPATNFPVFVQGMTIETAGDARFEIPAFAVGRQEVSNRDFKKFVDDGGYENPSYWSGLTLTDGSPLTIEVIESFVDKTGRAGPAMWELGTYPANESVMPIGGLSLYEAKAYARYRGLALPTLHHWARLAYSPAEGFYQTGPAMARVSNFDPNGPVPVDTEIGIGPWGTINTAGNVREWVWNTTGDLGFAMGGAWTDYPSIYQHAYTIEPMDRSPQNGLRLIHTLGEALNSDLLEPVEMNWDARFTRREPVGDEAFEAMRFQFTHVRLTPESVVSNVVEENDTWIAEEVELTFAGGRQAVVYVVKPSESPDVVQPVIYMPHAAALQKTANRQLLTHVPYLDFIVRAGRALVIPVWDYTAQRYEGLPDDPDARADRMRRTALAWYEDAATTIDYLEARKDIDASDVGFVGTSYGAFKSPIFLAIEQRFSAAIFIAGGTPYWGANHPMADPVNYLPRVTIPALMINGRYDHLFLHENSQKRMFELLGAPADQKRLSVYDEGHFDFPRNQVALEVSDWFDKYMSPAAK